jgi:hypothetical protein
MDRPRGFSRCSAGIRTRLETLKQSVREPSSYLFNDAVSRTVYVMLKGGVVSE